MDFYGGMRRKDRRGGRMDEEKGWTRRKERRGGRSNEECKTSKGAVYTAFVAPGRPKNKSVTNQWTNGRTDRGTHTHIESLRRD